MAEVQRPLLGPSVDCPRRWIVTGLCVLVLVCDYGLVRAKVEMSPDEGMAGTITFGQDMNDEGDFSDHMPDSLKCDACTLLAMKFTEKFDTLHKKRPSVKKFIESEILHAMDDVCSGPFDDYGIKEVKKVKRLAGPGLEASGAPGVTQSGGKWPQRLLKMCNAYLGEVGEMEIYEMYLKYKTLHKYLCEGSGVRGECRKTRRDNENRTRDKDEF